MPKKEFLITSSFGANQRLDVFLSERIKEVSRSLLQNAIKEEKVKVNDIFRKSSYRLKEGDWVEIEFEIPKAEKIEAEDIPLEIIYRDKHFIIIDKPPGMVVHPGAGSRRGTLVNALLHHFPEVKNIGPEERPGIVHRLDKETSGVMVIARTLKAYKELQRQFKRREVEKVYLGLVWGRMPENAGKIDWPIGRHLRHGERISVKTRKPRTAETHYLVQKEFKDFTLLEIKPVTGRTHQIRVHLAASGHSLVGDVRYGRRKSKERYTRLFLHALRISFIHPETKERVEFTSPLPEELKEILDIIQIKSRL